MTRSDWTKHEELGKGGQGTVWRASRVRSGAGRPNIGDLARVLNYLYTSSSQNTDYPDKSATALKLITDIAREEYLEFGALKELNKGDSAREPIVATARMEDEIAAMRDADHPHSLKILDHSSKGEAPWYVSEFHAGGSLRDQLAATKGRPAEALRRIRPIVEGVAQLHDRGQVHRDIKPENIFVAEDGRLVLRDFGLVFFEDSDRARLSKTLENVGSRPWMPMWAQGIRLEEVKPNFDLFSLGKVIWAMISGKPNLPFYYFKEPKHDLTTQFPADKSALSLVNEMLSLCIVEKEEEAQLVNANDLLEKIDEVVWRIDVGAGDLAGDIPRKCRVCGLGSYATLGDGWNRRGQTDLENALGWTGGSYNGLRVLSCSACGHLQIFAASRQGSEPLAWQHKIEP